MWGFTSSTVEKDRQPSGSRTPSRNWIFLGKSVASLPVDLDSFVALVVSF